MKQTHSLDGTWQVIYDHDNKGRTLNLQHRENFYACPDLEQITVPSCLEEFKQDYEGVAWYGKTFTLPSDWQNKTIRLHFGAVNYRAEIWVNGEAAGAHEGGYIGFELLIDDLLTEGENFIAVRVITPLILRDVVIDGIGRDDMPHWRGAIAGGIWQSVSLIATG
ncbi:MAG: beta galactosidase jelly roll domain-containing protein, partial [Gemmatimonadota bacterium]|nr:beta galactosidase jelly roll domain-containing protein [Gemmatimonadota bacterium]